MKVAEASVAGMHPGDQSLRSTFHREHSQTGLAGAKRIGLGGRAVHGRSATGLAHVWNRPSLVQMLQDTAHDTIGAGGRHRSRCASPKWQTDIEEPIHQQPRADIGPFFARRGHIASLEFLNWVDITPSNDMPLFISFVAANPQLARFRTVDTTLKLSSLPRFIPSRLSH